MGFRDAFGEVISTLRRQVRRHLSLRACIAMECVPRAFAPGWYKSRLWHSGGSSRLSIHAGSHGLRFHGRAGEDF